MREAFSQHLISMAQNDGVPVEVPFLLLRLLVEISLRITWETASQSSTTSWKSSTSVPGSQSVPNPRDKRKTALKMNVDTLSRMSLHLLYSYMLSSFK